MRRLIGTLLLAPLLALAPLRAPAQSAVSPADARAVRETFGSPENFMDMVRSSYAVVYRPKSVIFDAPVVLDGELIQPV